MTFIGWCPATQPKPRHLRRWGINRVLSVKWDPDPFYGPGWSLYGVRRGRR